MKTRAQHVAEQLTKHVRGTIFRMRDSTLRDLRREIGGLTMTNCWCRLYDMREALLRFTEEEIERRKLAAKKKEKT